MTKHRFAAIVALAAALWVPDASARIPRGPAPVILELDRLTSKERISLQIEDAPAAKVLEEIASAAALHLSFDGPEECCLVGVSLTNVTVQQALEAVAAQTNLRYEGVDSDSLRVTLPSPLLPTDDMKMPELATKIDPAYPEDAREAGVGGTIVLQAAIREDGVVGDVKVLSAVPGWPSLDRNAVEAVRRWRYRPAVQDGEPVSISYTVTVEFRPEQD